MTEEKVRSYWQSADSPKVKSYLERHRGQTSQADVRFVDALVAPTFAGKRVLDIGAGLGRFVPIWSRHGVRLTSCEWSPPFFRELERVSREHKQDCVLADVSCGMPAGPYDLVFSSQLLLHIHPVRLMQTLEHAAMAARRELIFISWQGDPPFDTRDTGKHQSFNHDYPTHFEKAGLQIEFEMELLFEENERRGPVRNKVFYLVRA